MKFGEEAIEQAEGLILAHSVRLAGRALKKGHVLTADDIATLRRAGIAAVSGARLEASDMAEDEAAAALATAACGPGLSRGKAFTGRCNLFAEVSGLAVADSARIDRINLLDEALTIGTIPSFAAVEPGRMIATVKVIPFAAPRAVLDACVAIAAEGEPLLRVAPFAARRVGLVQTRLPGMKESVLDATTGAVATRLRGLNSRLAGEIRCHHRVEEIGDAMRQLLERGAQLILIAGASAIVDRRDVVPAGIVAAGGAIDHFGMPVDPGNLLLLAHHGAVPVLGMPGCARSPKLNGLDWVLRRLLAGLPLSGADIMGMGAGGLLMEIGSRPLPRAAASPKPEHGPRPASAGPPRVAALLLAAGQSRRMGRKNKLLAEIDGVAMVARAVDAILASRAAPVIVVTGHQEEQVAAVLAGRAVEIVHNPDFAEGMSTSLCRGLEALPAEIDGALVCLGDMPHINAALIDRLIDGFDPADGRAIGVPVHKGKRGNPVLWAAHYFPEMMRVAGDVGARHLIGEHAEAVYEIESPDRSVTLDVDTPEALDALATHRG